MAQQVYKLDPATAQAFGATSLTSCTGFTLSEEATVTNQGSDGKPFIQGVYVDDVLTKVELTALDFIDVLMTATPASLVLKTALHSSGTAAGTVKTFTISNAVLVNKSKKTSHAGMSEMVYTFHAYSSDGTTSPIAIT